MFLKKNKEDMLFKKNRHFSLSKKKFAKRVSFPLKKRKIV